MKKQIFVIVVSILLSFFAGLVMGWLIPKSNMILPGDRAHLIDSWTNSRHTEDITFYENGSCLTRQGIQTFNVMQDRILIIPNNGKQTIYRFFYIGNRVLKN